MFFVPASKSVSDAKTVIPMVKQPVFLRSMSAPSDLEMIASQDLEFTHAPQRYSCLFLFHRQDVRGYYINCIFDHFFIVYYQKATPPDQPPQQLLHPAAVSSRGGQQRQANL